MAKTEKEKKPEKAKEPKKDNKKEKKEKGKKGADANPPLSSMSPDQMTAQQLEQAIKESQDPDARLKKIKSPINVKSCLLNVLILIILTLGIVVLWCFLEVDRFNFVTVVKDMSDQFGITAAFQGMGEWFKGLFGGG
ncbi:MAG: hypothetical protein J1F33_06590 [Clostridiales bacterium]|nr:hypothetical protein [Clostridiales bacterium]